MNFRYISIRQMEFCMINDCGVRNHEKSVGEIFMVMAVSVSQEVLTHDVKYSYNDRLWQQFGGYGEV